MVDEKLGSEREAMLILANEIFVMEILVDVISLEGTFKIGSVCNVNLEDRIAMIQTRRGLL